MVYTAAVAIRTPFAYAVGSRTPFVAFLIYFYVNYYFFFTVYTQKQPLSAMYVNTWCYLTDAGVLYTWVNGVAVYSVEWTRSISNRHGQKCHRLKNFWRFPVRGLHGSLRHEFERIWAGNWGATERARARSSAWAWRNLRNRHETPPESLAMCKRLLLTRGAAERFRKLTVSRTAKSAKKCTMVMLRNGLKKQDGLWNGKIRQKK